MRDVLSCLAHRENPKIVVVFDVLTAATLKGNVAGMYRIAVS
jgi:hypothetical protein